MIHLDILLYSYVCGAMLMMSLLGLESAAVAPSLDHWDKRSFVAFFGALVVASATYFPELIAYINPTLMVAMNIAYYLQSLCFMIPTPILAAYMLHSCKEDWRASPLFRAILALFATYFLLLNLTPFTDCFYSVTPSGDIILGPMYRPTIMIPILIIFLFLVGTIQRRSRLSLRRYRAFLTCQTPVLISLIIHTFVATSFTLVDVCLVLSGYMAYRMILSEAIEQNARQQQEIERQRASIAVLQMRPHFIHNTMTSIYYLCDTDPKAAQRVTMDFNTYLRKNFRAIAKEGTIPFSEELEHTRAYLAVEQAQFGKKLVVEFDTPHTKFRLPPLTLQPLAENSVKHGMGPHTVPLHVCIRTRQTEEGSEVVVEDGGPGFDSAVADDPATTLANIRQRLEMMCGATLDFAPREGGGTVARVRIPWQKGA